MDDEIKIEPPTGEDFRRAIMRITKIIISRTLIYKGTLCKGGNIWVSYSFIRDNCKYTGAIQVNSMQDKDYGKSVDEYIEKTYIYTYMPLPVKVNQFKARKPKRQFDSRARTQH